MANIFKKVPVFLCFFSIFCNIGDAESHSVLGSNKQASLIFEQQSSVLNAGQFWLINDYKSHPTYTAFKSYEKEYWELDMKCARSTPRGNMALINVTHCVWRKDQLLMAKYELDDLIFDLAAERYQRIFQLAKTTSIESLSGNADFLLKQYLRNMLSTMDDYLKLQEIRVKRHLK
mgnify:CR=1 FL=1